MTQTVKCPHCGGVVATTSVSMIESLLTSYSRKNAHGAWDAFTYQDGKTFDIPGLGTVVLVEHLGGHEDDGSYTHLIFRISDGDGETDSYYRKTGSYDSWDGTDWDGPFEEVISKTRTTTSYEPVGK